MNGMAWPPADLVPSLRSVVEANGLNQQTLSVALETDGRGNIRVSDRHSVPVSDGKKMTVWLVPSLRELFRGNQKPPVDLKYYPKEVVLHLYFIEKHFMTLCKAKGDRTDQEIQEIYATLRRRPDGRSLGAAHDFLWQVAALWLGSNVISAEEYEAFLGLLERSVGKWAIRPVSRNYATYLFETFGKTR